MPAGLVAQVDESELFRPLYDLRMFMLAVTAGVLMAGLISSYFVAKVSWQCQPGMATFLPCLHPVAAFPTMA